MNEKTADPSLIKNMLRTILIILLMISLLSQTANASELVILFSNDIRGETDPCG